LLPRKRYLNSVSRAQSLLTRLVLILI
jgi:hypothetical protein